MQARIVLQLVSSLFALSTFTACERQTPASSPPLPAQFDPEVSAKIDRLEQQLLFLESRVNSLEADSSAEISVENERYGLVRTRHGNFTISAKAVTPYLDGFKVVLQIGNLTSADFEGAEISVAWGSPFKNRKEFKLLNRFSAGSFSDAEVALTPAKAEDVKKLIVGISVNQLVLRTR